MKPQTNFNLLNNPKFGIQNADLHVANNRPCMNYRGSIIMNTIDKPSDKDSYTLNKTDVQTKHIDRVIVAI